MGVEKRRAPGGSAKLIGGFDPPAVPEWRNWDEGRQHPLADRVIFSKPRIHVKFLSDAGQMAGLIPVDWPTDAPNGWNKENRRGLLGILRQNQQESVLKFVRHNPIAEPLLRVAFTVVYTGLYFPPDHSLLTWLGSGVAFDVEVYEVHEGIPSSREIPVRLDRVHIERQRNAVRVHLVSKLHGVAAPPENNLYKRLESTGSEPIPEDREISPEEYSPVERIQTKFLE